MNKITIGIMGTSQIKHIIPVIKDQYDVINLQEIWDGKGNKLSRIIGFAKAVSKCDILYNVFTSHYFWKKGRIAKFYKKKVITHWIGSDARMAEEGKTNLNKLKFVDQHIACFKPIQDQMEKLGINTKYLPIIPYNLNFDICQMPEEHSVLIYMPKGFENYYGFDEISRVFPKFPHVKFYIVANDDKEKFADYQNVETLGYLPLEEMESLYNRISIVVRIHVNDGLSMSVLEGMAKGKKIVWNYEFPYCLPGSTTEEICASINEILQTTPTPRADKEAHDYIAVNFSKERFMSLFNEIIDGVLKK